MSSLLSSRPLNRSIWLPHTLLWVVVLVAVVSLGCRPARTEIHSPESQNELRAEALPVHEVTQSNSSSIVVARGKLGSRSKRKVLCEVNDLPVDGVYGTPVIWIVSNGAVVSEGDLLVELDGTHFRERLDRQILTLEQARAAQVRAEAKLAILRSQNALAKGEAELKLQMTKLDLSMYIDPQGGVNAQETAAIERHIEELESEVNVARTVFESAREDCLRTENRFKEQSGQNSEQPTITWNDVQRLRLDMLEKERLYAGKMNELKTAQAALQKKKTYERRMNELELQRKVDTAQRKLEQIQVSSQAKLAQAQATLDAANQSLEKHGELLARYKDQLEKCKIFAPVSGVVVYPSSDDDRSELIGPGYFLRSRQCVLEFPDLAKMQVNATVSEDTMSRVAVGQPAVVRVAAFADRTFAGKVESIDVLPRRRDSLQTATGQYSVVIALKEEARGLIPGMSAVAEIECGPPL